MASPRSMDFILFAAQDGTITREVGQAAGLGQVMGELIPRHKSQRGAASAQKKGTPFSNLHKDTHVASGSPTCLLYFRERILTTDICSWIQLMFTEHSYSSDTSQTLGTQWSVRQICLQPQSPEKVSNDARNKRTIQKTVALPLAFLCPVPPTL